MNESVIERFASTPEGRELLEREEARLNAEIELADFQHSIQRNEARQEVCEAAVEWWRLLNDETAGATAWDAKQCLYEAAGRLAELEEQCNSET